MTAASDPRPAAAALLARYHAARAAAVEAGLPARPEWPPSVLAAVEWVASGGADWRPWTRIARAENRLNRQLGQLAMFNVPGWDWPEALNPANVAGFAEAALADEVACSRALVSAP